jgi:hypothetical protein
MVIVLTVAIVAGSAPVAAGTDPLVNWSSPFEQRPADSDVVQVDDGTVRLNASVDEPIDYVEIQREYSDARADDRAIYRVDDLNNVTVHAGTFRQTAIRVRVFGTQSPAPDTTAFNVNVDDTEAPTVNVDTEAVGDNSVRLYGRFTDDTQPERLTIRLPNRSNPAINANAVDNDGTNTAGIEVADNSVEFDLRFKDPGSSTVTVRVRDRADNERDIEVPLPDPAADDTATPTATPTVTETPNATPEPTVTPVPTAATPAPTPTATAAPSTDTQTPAPTTTPSGGAGPLAVIFRFLIIGVGLFAIGGWLSLQ